MLSHGKNFQMGAYSVSIWKRNGEFIYEIRDEADGGLAGSGNGFDALGSAESAARKQVTQFIIKEAPAC